MNQPVDKAMDSNADDGEYLAMKVLEADMDEAEINLRYRAFG
jgi:hypothetical protein